MGQDHFLGVDLVNRPFALDEMGWGIAVRPPLADMRELLGEEALAHCALAAIVPVERFPFLVREAGPMGDARLEDMGEIHEPLGLDDG